MPDQLELEDDFVMVFDSQDIAAVADHVRLARPKTCTGALSTATVVAATVRDGDYRDLLAAWSRTPYRAGIEFEWLYRNGVDLTETGKNTITTLDQARDFLARRKRLEAAGIDMVEADVILRRFRDDHSLIALFPELPGTNDDSTCLSYMHVGQHGTASAGLADVTDRVPYAPLPDDARALLRELEATGYVLTLKHRFTPAHRALRQAAIDSQYAAAPTRAAEQKGPTP